jgi:tRNA-dihydrouridine synthase
MNFWSALPKPFTVLAPMEDVTDSAFRQFIAFCGRPDVFFTEFTSTDGLCSAGYDAVSHRLKFTEIETPLVAQIWGNNPENYFKAVTKLKEMGFAGIDINMGCPVDKVVKKGCCAALINNPELAKELYLAAKEAANGIPVSIKTRIGFKKKQTESWIATLLELKPPALTVHARTAKQLSNYPADWDEILKSVELKNSISPDTIVIGNGDVSSQADCLHKHKTYQVDGLMIGRGIFKNPFIFNFKDGVTDIDQLSSHDRIALLKKHTDFFKLCWQDKKPYAILKKYFKIYIANFAGASELRAKLMETSSIDEAVSILDTLDNHQSILA